MMRLLWRFFAWGMLLTFVGLIGTVLVFHHYGKELPSYTQLANYKPAITSRFYASDGCLFGEYAFEKRLYVPIDAIPPLVIQAFLSAEDKNFYHHFGIDPLSILSAAIHNISRLQESKRPIGASTITQQVARNFLLTDISTLISLDRKIKEAILAFRIEQAYSKDYILELYLNQIYLGAGAYGVASAALTYFNKRLDDLTLDEIAYLAGLPKAPSHYHPIKSPNAAKIRRDYVIKRMEEDNVITHDQAQKAYKAELTIKPRLSGQVTKADFFAEEVRREMVDQYGEKALYKEGFVVRTTLKPHLQAMAEASLKEGLIKYDRRHGWRGPLKHLESLSAWQNELKNFTTPLGDDTWQTAVVLDLEKDKAHIGLSSGKGIIPLQHMLWARPYHGPDHVGAIPQKPGDILTVGDIIIVSPLNNHYELQQIPAVSGGLLCMNPQTGAVLAMQGGFSFKLSQYNRATQAKRQPGSAFKGFVYLTALEKGYTPSSIFDDAPFSIDIGHGIGIWRPRNYDNKFKGPMTLRRAFELSRNLVTVRMIYENVGMKNVIETAKRFGITDHMPLQLAMVLGAGETTLLKMVRAHAILANGGTHITPTFIERIQDRQGKTVLKPLSIMSHDSMLDKNHVPRLTDHRQPVTDKVSAYQMISLFEGAVARGTGRALKDLPYAIGGKSGTTNDFKDAWFIAMTPELVVGAYVGFDHPRYLGKHENGGRLAAPIVRSFMEKALKTMPTKPFPIPPGIKLVRVNLNTGKQTPTHGTMILEAFKAGTEQEAYEPSLPILPPDGDPKLPPPIPSQDLSPGMEGLY